MKKILLFSAFLGCFALGHAQTKNVVVETAGTLSTLIPAEEVSTLTTLTVSGSINKTDLDTLNGMPALTTLDLSQANIETFTEKKTTTIIDGETSKDTIIEIIYPDNEIPSNVFESNEILENIVFPNSLESIGTNAFSTCRALKNLNFSNCPELKKIDSYAFGSIQETLTHVSFNGCSKLTSIGDYAFTQGKAIETIDFTGCSALTHIGNRAFLNVWTVETIDLSSCTALSTINDNSFRGTKKASSLILPENVKVIGENAFYQCNALETITIPASVDSIAPYAFYQPKALKTVICKGTATQAAERAFTSVTSTSKPAEENYSDPGYKLIVPKGCADTYRAGIEWAKFPTIEEAESGAIDATEILSDVHVYAAGNAVVVDGAAAGKQVSVIGLSGYAAQNAVADGSTLSLTIEQKGLFLVKVGTSVFKVIL